MSISQDFSAVHDGHVRLAILRLLDEQPGYCANDSVLHDAVNAVGLNATRSQIRGHIEWLQEQRLVKYQAAGSGLLVVTLSERGSDVANGRSVIAGVQRPSPSR
ncbi:hypothetical protein [Novosphingobium sp.]|uniref:VpaChn25_0724 family phage protein n=1 Tax=Novosphingobium sp. TaxID=1874826 RepID=UPI0026321B5F|nr:hypothetical protein [Novosphingobium sp.]